MRTILAVCGLLLTVVGCDTTPKKPNPLFQPPGENPFTHPIYAAPTTGEMPSTDK